MPTKSRFVCPKFESINHAIVLSANDVVATVLMVSPDEHGYEPLTIADVSLPFNAREYRQTNSLGKSWLQRGDLITIKCTVTKEPPFKAHETVTDKDINDILNGMRLMEDDNADLFSLINAEQLRFSKEWDALCKRDLEKRARKRGAKTP